MDDSGCGAEARAREVRPVSDTTRLRALSEAGLMHPNPDAVLAPLFTGGSGFFLASDKVQVKYEMLRARLVDGVSVSEAAAAHGYSRAAFYLVVAAFDQSGMAGLIDERRGRRGPVKLRPEIVEFIGAEDGAAAEGGAGRLRNTARPRVRACPATRESGRGPVRPSRAGRADRLAQCRAGVRRRTPGRRPSGLGSA